MNSAFIGTDLEDYLRSKEITSVVITGLTTPHCISTTTRMRSNLGFQTMLISDATAAFELKDHMGISYDPETVHQVSLATLHDEFAAIFTSGQLIDKINNQSIMLSTQ